MGSGQYFVVRVGSAIFGLDIGLENFPLKSQFFNFSLPVKKYLWADSKNTRVKGGSASYLLQVNRVGYLIIPSTVSVSLLESRQQILYYLLLYPEVWLFFQQQGQYPHIIGNFLKEYKANVS